MEEEAESAAICDLTGTAGCAGVESTGGWRTLMARLGGDAQRDTVLVFGFNSRYIIARGELE